MSEKSVEAEAKVIAKLSDYNEESAPSGALVVNADDWGRDRLTTDRTLDGINTRTVSSVSAMVFMEDSERAADLARVNNVDAGLHLNLSAPFSGKQQSDEQHRKIIQFLTCHALARVVYHPGLAKAFDYVVKAQLEEFARLYDHMPSRIDGHHHLHLCSNVLVQNLLPSGTVVRRNFTFTVGEKSRLNRYYRRAVDDRLARRHEIVDFLYNLQPIRPLTRLTQILSVAKKAFVELEAHLGDPEEHRFLTNGEFVELLEGVQVAPRFQKRTKSA